MDGIAFEWDPHKDAANIRNHGVAFAEASSVFGDPLSITILDPAHSLEEDRLVIIGMSERHRLLVVVHTVRADAVNQCPRRYKT